MSGCSHAAAEGWTISSFEMCLPTADVHCTASFATSSCPLVAVAIAIAVSDTTAARCAILLDELDDYRGLRKGRALGHIVVETRTANAIPLLRYSCSKRTLALPTGQLNARRVSEEGVGRG